MDSQLKRSGNTLVVRMNGELDHHAADGLRAQIDRKLAQNEFRNIIFNFTGVEFMDSSGLGMILGRYRQAAEKGGKVLACALNPRVMRVFELAALQKKIAVFASEQEALRNIQGGSQ